MGDRVDEYIRTFAPECEECGGVRMDVVSRDRTQVICPCCWLPKPVPHTHLPTHVKLAEVKRIKSFQTKRTT